jgi:hypothetical protein
MNSSRTVLPVEIQPFNSDSLNETQKNIIEGYLRFHIDDITESLIPAMAARAMEVILDGKWSSVRNNTHREHPIILIVNGQ